MNNKYIVGIIAVVAILLIGGYIVSNSKDNKQVASDSDQTTEEAMQKADGDAMENKDGDAMEKEGEEAMKGEAMMEKVDSDTMAKQPGTYQDYSASKVDSEQAKGNKVVLFFHASWCPTCKAADAAFKANTSSIPEGVTVLKIDYDSNTELRNKYGLTYQHTFVQLDNNENKITSWVSGDIANLKANIK